MSAAREKDSADFDLERFVDMFDEALTSQDPRVINALRSLMMMVTLTRPESRDSGLHDRNHGPLRRLYEDVNHLNSRMHRMEDEVRQLKSSMFNRDVSYKDAYKYDYPYEKFSMQAAQQMADKIDQDLLNQLKSSYRTKIQGLK
jgi:vacuolar-type H+-ATPase subunit I/STV1